MSHDIRWKQRFENFERAFLLLQSALKNDVNALSDLEQEGVIQRFEYTFELGWNTLKDYLVFNGVQLDQNTPRNVIKQAFAAKLISNGQLWIEMMDYRNRLSHKYDFAIFRDAVRKIQREYLRVFEEVYSDFKKRSLE